MTSFSATSRAGTRSSSATGGINGAFASVVILTWPVASAPRASFTRYWPIVSPSFSGRVNSIAPSTTSASASSPKSSPPSANPKASPSASESFASAGTRTRLPGRPVTASSTVVGGVLLFARGTTPTLISPTARAPRASMTS